uniref:DDE_Tnp_1_7 domain-containing protein n=1 Tax=Macrostomum lignano TaxID=282301 RepID=A0A1I8FHU3_9PLAT
MGLRSRMRVSNHASRASSVDCRPLFHCSRTAVLCVLKYLIKESDSKAQHWNKRPTMLKTVSICFDETPKSSGSQKTCCLLLFARRSQNGDAAVGAECMSDTSSCGDRPVYLRGDHQYKEVISRVRDRHLPPTETS